MRSVGVAPEMNLGIMQVIKEGPILVLKPSDKQGEQGYQWPKKTLKKKVSHTEYSFRLKLFDSPFGFSH